MRRQTGAKAENTPAQDSAGGPGAVIFAFEPLDVNLPGYVPSAPSRITWAKGAIAGGGRKAGAGPAMKTPSGVR